MEKMTFGVLCALEDVELPHVLESFDLDRNTSPKMSDSVSRYWESEIETIYNKKCRVIISCLSEPGNVSSVTLTKNIIDQFNPDLMIFVGIACGIKNFNLGDVVTAQTIWAYEYVKERKDQKPSDRSRPLSVSFTILQAINFFREEEFWRKNLIKIYSKFHIYEQPRNPNFTPSLKKNIWIASGEKVMADGKLSRLNQRHDSIKAGDMEGYGFASACSQRSKPVEWVVVRGISDYGDSSKDNNDPNSPLKDEYHPFAAAAAAAFCRTFLERSDISTSLTYLQSESMSMFKGLEFYSSNSDPEFTKKLILEINDANRKIVFTGLGHSLIKKNPEIINSILNRLTNNPDLKVDFFYADPHNTGLKNRVNEEFTDSSKKQVYYRLEWPEIYSDSLVKKVKSKIKHIDLQRVGIFYINFMPMNSLIQIDNNFFYSPYGTPNIKGPDSPWIFFSGSYDNAFYRFIAQCIEYFSDDINISKKLMS